MERSSSHGRGLWVRGSGSSLMQGSAVRFTVKATTPVAEAGSCVTSFQPQDRWLQCSSVLEELSGKLVKTLGALRSRDRSGPLCVQSCTSQHLEWSSGQTAGEESGDLW